VIAEPVAAVQLREMAGGAALAQLSAQRMDSPRAAGGRRAAGGMLSCDGLSRLGCGTSGSSRGEQGQLFAGRLQTVADHEVSYDESDTERNVMRMSSLALLLIMHTCSPTISWRIGMPAEIGDVLAAVSHALASGFPEAVATC